MAQQTGYSPSFKRPAQILRMRRTRSGLGASSRPVDGSGQSGSPAACSLRPFPPGPLSPRRSPSRGGGKRRNPFANLENPPSPKKNRVVEEDGEREQDCLQLLDSEETSRDEDHLDSRERSREEDPHGGSVETAQQQQQVLSKSPGSDGASSYPADWSLKTRLLFTSPRSLSWAEQPRAQEEALALHRHSRAHFTPSDPGSCSELRCALQQALVYWQQPSLPWISMFPRINAQDSFTRQNRPWTQDGAVEQSLRRDWSLSLSSLYSLLKAKVCPYFYLCSYQVSDEAAPPPLPPRPPLPPPLPPPLSCQFTVLFRAPGLGGSSSISALLSPTSRGLREAMKDEGIDFRLPLVEQRSRKWSDQDNRVEEGADLHHSDEEDEDDSLDWLQEMGVQDKVKTPGGLTIQLQKQSHAVSLDHRPESVAVVEGAHTFTLINFLINWRGVVAGAGPQAGLPPTLLSPVAFRGGAMHLLKSRCVNIKSQVDFSYQNLSSLEITGPVLPSCLHAITQLLQRSQEGEFLSVLSTHRPTAVLNTDSSQLQGGAAAAPPPMDLSSCGLHPDTVQQLLQPSTLGKTALTHIKMSQNRFSWKS